MDVITTAIREGHGASYKGDVASFREFVRRFNEAHDREAYEALRAREPGVLARVLDSCREFWR